MRGEAHVKEGVRASALWGKRSGSRGSALWGKGGRGFAAFLGALVMVAGPLAAVGESKSKPRHLKRTAAGIGSVKYKDVDAFVTPTLLEKAAENPDKLFHVIIQGDGSRGSGFVARLVADEVSKDSGSSDAREKRFYNRELRAQFSSVNGIAAQVSGKLIVRLAGMRGVTAITPDGPVEFAGYENRQKWAHVSEVAKYWRALDWGLVKPPAIAIVDSGIEANRADFGWGSRVVHQRVMTSLAGNSAGDGRGHGTFVAGLAAGVGKNFAGAAPGAPIVSIDVMDDQGMARTSDVIAAADWILQNKNTYNIKVANFSLHSSVPNSFMYDPLAKAVERLWFSGVVVVAAAGNYASNGQQSGVLFAPGSDPFVITVGAADIGRRLDTDDDFQAPWSAYGYTPDGFRKPDVGAPGRYIIGPVPSNSTLIGQRPDQGRQPGYMELSGTSMAAPIVAGMAAYIVATHPTWTPDQVKGALMLTAKPAGRAAPWGLGVGLAQAQRAAWVSNPPNPNAALNQFVGPDAASGQKAFNAASWANVAQANASWASASWASASWASASWASASWASASWASASWASASWASASLAAASWASSSWAVSTFEDGASVDPGIGGLVLSLEEEEILGLLDPPSDQPPAIP
jgi:serine protease AprX